MHDRVAEKNICASEIDRRSGSLYGTTVLGGSSSACTGGCGTVFKLAPDLTETVLHTFSWTDGAAPASGLIFDAQGNLYGTTGSGGSHCSYGGCGTVFKIAP